MKTALATLIALGLLAGAASAHDAKVFADINATAPKSIFDQIRDTAPRSDGVFGQLKKMAP